MSAAARRPAATAVRRAATLALLGLLLVATAVARAEPAPTGADRVVFYGDSITEQRLWTRYVQQFLYVRHPESDTRYFNAGWGGDTVPGATKRLARDVLVLRPTVVTLFFGMNDGGYRTPDDGVRDRYREGLDALVAEIQRAGARVVVYGPGCVDPDRNPALGTAGYNDALAGLAAAAAEVAKARRAPFGEVHGPMLAYQTARKRRDPSFTMVPDAIHPDDQGHLVMAAAMLPALGAEPMPPLGRFDLATKKGEGLRLLASEADAVTLETTAPVLTPYWIAEGSLTAARETGFLDALAGQRLTVGGLAAGDWEVAVDGAEVGRWSAADLARGVAVPGTWSAKARRVHDLVQMKERQYFTTWRETRLPLEGVEGSDRVVEGLLAADEGYHRAIRAAAAPLPSVRITLARGPVGENLALGRPYESSDPNAFGWGTGGLTDGSWEASAKHCFATGNAASFPKWVTVDLGRSARVGVVRLGVPEFGSTKTIAVAVSGDGRKFHPVGVAEFASGAAARRTLRFEPRAARYVRLTYEDRHATVLQYPSEFAFTTELEVYGAK